MYVCLKMNKVTKQTHSVGHKWIYRIHVPMNIHRFIITREGISPLHSILKTRKIALFLNSSKCEYIRDKNLLGFANEIRPIPFERLYCLFIRAQKVRFIFCHRKPIWKNSVKILNLIIKRSMPPMGRITFDECARGRECVRNLSLGTHILSNLLG